MEIWKNMEKLWKLTYDLCFNSIAHSPNIPYVFLQHSIISACFLSVFLTSRKEFDWIERFVSILYHSHFCRVQQTSKLGPYWYGQVHIMVMVGSDCFNTKFNPVCFLVYSNLTYATTYYSRIELSTQVFCELIPNSV